MNSLSINIDRLLDVTRSLTAEDFNYIQSLHRASRSRAYRRLVLRRYRDVYGV